MILLTTMSSSILIRCQSASIPRSGSTRPIDPVSVTYFFAGGTKFALKKEGEYWRGTVRPPEGIGEGWNLSFVFIKYKRSDLDRKTTEKILSIFKKMFAAVKLTNYKEFIVIEGKVWIRAYSKQKVSGALIRIAPQVVSAETAAPPAANEVSITPTQGTLIKASPEVLAAPVPVMTGNVSSAATTLPASLEPVSATPESPSSEEALFGGLQMKGSKSINFVSRSIEGSKEGFTGGYTREESLRLNISGKVDKDTDVDADFISTSSSGTTATTLTEDKVSVLVRHASTEVYYGDMIADFNDTEFARMNKSLSGVKVTGDYGKWGFEALYSTPRGDSKYFKSYGNNTQGPYNLGFAPVVVDSDRVLLNGTEQKRGDDYTIDYQAGTITFRHAIVLNTWIIEVYYDYSETVFQHATVGLRYRNQINDDLKMGFTYLDDSDQLYQASDIVESMNNTVEPVSHYLIGLDGSGKVWNTQFNSELAYSNMDLNILDPGEVRQIGKAFKLDTVTDQGPFDLQTNFKRVGPFFTAISDASPKQDEWQNGAVLDYRPSSVYFAEAGYQHDDYSLLGTRYLTEYTDFKSKFTPSDIPTLNYYYHQNLDSNDPVLTTPIDRLTTKHNVDSSYRYGFLVSNIGGGYEEWVNHEPSREVTIYKTVNFGTATYGLDKISASGNIELKDTQLPNDTNPYTKTYTANVSVTPTPNYFGSLTSQVVDDSIGGTTNVTDLNYRASPFNNFSTDGKYTIQSVQEDFNGTSEGVTKQTGSFRFDLRPADTVRFRYYYKPNFTRVERSDSFSFNDLVNQGEFSYAPLRELSTSIVYKTENTMNIDRTDPELHREANHQDTYDTTFLIDSAPISYLSLEFLYDTLDLGLTQQTTAGATSYDDTSGNTKKYQFTAKTALNERFSIDSSYSYQKQLQGSDISTSNVDTVAQTVYGKGLWNYDDSWTYYVSYSYTESVDNLQPGDNTTYTAAPGAGVTYRSGSILWIDSSYERSLSYAATSSQVDTYVINMKYDPSQYVHLNLKGTREISVDPDYKTTEILGSLEIVL